MHAPAQSAPRSLRSAAAMLLWALQPLAIAWTAPALPPLLQATIASTGALFVFWVWTRWRQIPVFALDSSLRPGVGLALLAASRLGLLYPALARGTPLQALVLAFAALLLARALLQLSRGGPRLACLAATLLALLALLAGMLPAAVRASGALFAGLLWALELELGRRPALRACAPEKRAYYQLIGAVVLLPVGSVALGENWSLHVGAWPALLLQIAAGALLLPPWVQRRGAGLRLLHLLALTLLLTLALQSLLLQPPPPMQLLACALLAPAAWLLRSGASAG